MVIAIHCYTISTNIYSNVWYCEIAIRQVFNCAVPIFLAISGYFLSKSSKSSKDLIIKQIKQIYLPTLIWSIPYFILYIKEGGNPIKGILMLFVCGFSIYYFIALIFQCYALSPLLKKVKLGGVIISGIITSITISIVTYLMQIKMYNIPLIVYGGPIITWVVFFVLGYYLGKEKVKYPICIWIILLILFFLLSCLESIYLYPFKNGGFGIKLSSHLYSICCIMILFSEQIQAKFKENIKINRLITKVGKDSFGIYLTHNFFIIILRKYTTDIHWTILFLIITLVTFISIQICKYILKEKSRLIGFR